MKIHWKPKRLLMTGMAMAGVATATSCASSVGQNTDIEGAATSESTAALNLDFSWPCADATPGQPFSGGMVGCPGSVVWAKRASLCGAGRHPASAQEWAARQNGITPLHDYWTNDDLHFEGTSSHCSVSATYGKACPFEQPMRVCTAAGTDAEGNHCTWTRCSLGSSEYGFFGGCSSDPTAGTLCVKDCADGSTDQVFANGMVGCAATNTWDNRSAACGVSHVVANAAQWSTFQGIESVGDPPHTQALEPDYDYWTDTNLKYLGTGSSTCSATPFAGGTACPSNEPMRVCTSAGSDSIGNACRWTDCGYASSTSGASLGGCMGNSTAGAVCLPDTDIYCDGSGCISAKKFAASINAQLQNKVVGYLSIVGSQVMEWGQARTSADPPAMPMANNVPFHMASISKVLTTIAALQVLAAHGLTVDNFIAPYLPPDWAKGPGVVSTPTLPGITFRQLLTHTAGFRNAGFGTYAELKGQIQQGVTQSDKMKPLYDNLNFALFRILLPFIQATPPFVSNISFSDPGPGGRDLATQEFYSAYLLQYVFHPLAITDATLLGPSSAPFALYYPFPAGSAHGAYPGDWNPKSGGGGWNLSGAEIFRVLSSLAWDNLLLSDAQKVQMNDGCLGWDCSVMSQPDYVGKNGLLLPGGAGSGYSVNTFIGLFKGQMPVVVLTNSDPGANLYNIIRAAHTTASVPQP